MEVKQELQLRCSLALDFIYQSINNGELTPAYQDDKPVDSNKCSMELRLKTISLLFFCSDFFDKKHLSVAAEQMLDKVLEYRFHKTESACLIKDDQSFTSWQISIAAILFKENKHLDAVAFMETLRDSVRNSYVEAFYLLGTHDEIIEKAPKLESALGILVLVFLLGHRYFDQVGYEHMAKFLGDLIVKKGRFDALDVWAMRVLNDINPDAKYKHHVDHISARINSIATISMSSLVAAMVQQSNLAWIDKDNSQREKIDEILQYQLSLQDTKTGAFQRTPSNNEIRLDYTVQNVISFLLYLNRIEGEKMDILKLLT